jgi:UDP-GlcNAc3NAcA epimerase
MKIVTVVGARPQFVKAAVISRLIRETDGIDEVLVHTGQHFDNKMSSIFFTELQIPEPQYNLEIYGGGHGEMTGRMMEAVEKVVLKEKPDIVLVYGDTNSTLAGGLVASKMHIPVAHVEAGLRSFNRKMPEEINRILVDHVSDLLFCPTNTAIDNLANEGITKGVHHVGDVMYDMTLFAKEGASQTSTILEDLDIEPHSYALCTIHRAENTDTKQALERVIFYLNEQAKNQQIILPIHPRTRAALERYGINVGDINLIEPVSFLDLHKLLGSANAVFTDSGGLQKEAYFHGVPCVTLRDETEWIETIVSGWNRLWLVDDYIEPRRVISQYGDGSSAEKIISLIKDMG